MTKTATKQKTSGEAKSPPLLITRIQIKDNRAIISYHDDKDFSLNEGTHTGKDDCTGDFLQKFDSAKEIFGEIIQGLRNELPTITMNVIKFEYNKQGFLDKVLMVVKYKFNKQGNVTNISTGNIPIYNDNLGENTVCVSGKHIELLHEIIQKAKDYMKGDTGTKQLKVVVDNTEEK